MSEKPNLTDAGVGRAIFTTKFQLSLQAAKMCFFVGFLPGLIIPLAIWFLSVKPHDFDLVKIDIIASFGNTEKPMKWRIRDESGERQIISVQLNDGKEIRDITKRQIKEVMRPYSLPVVNFYTYFWTSIFCSILGYIFVWWFLKNFGAGSQENKRLRGAFELVEASMLKRLVRAKGASKYKLADVPIPNNYPMRGINVMGAPGSGKSVAIHDLMTQVFSNKGKKVVIYDHSGEYFAAYFRPGKDYFFNPALLDSVCWSIFKELTYDYDADKLAQAFLPPKKQTSAGSGAFFEDAARALFSVILLRLTKRGAIYTRDLARAFLEMPADEMDLLIRNSIASSAVGGDSKGQRQGVIASIAIYLNGISSVGNGTWNLKSFFEEDNDSRLFIVNTDDTKAMFAPLYRLMLTLAFNTIAAKGNIQFDDKYWFFLDEVHQLGDIRLDEHAATLRKFGVCIVSGIQSDSQYSESMSESRAEVVLNCFSTYLMLQSAEENMQKRMSTRIGTMEVDAVNRNQALAVTEWRDGAGLNTMEKAKEVVMPSEFGTLNELEGYIKFTGSFPAAKTSYRHWLQKRFFGIFGKRRVDDFSKKNPLPPKDPSFKISPAEFDENPLDKIRQEVEDEKRAAEEKSEKAPVSESKGGSAALVVQLDTQKGGGELGRNHSTEIVDKETGEIIVTSFVATGTRDFTHLMIDTNSVDVKDDLRGGITNKDVNTPSNSSITPKSDNTIQVEKSTQSAEKNENQKNVEPVQHRAEDGKVNQSKVENKPEIDASKIDKINTKALEL